jgi:hypothetical protein
MSLEVAEHLPPDRSNSFIAELTALAPVALFSAAIPQQGGTDHINERWQSYWAGLFKKRGFSPLDVIRPAVWENDAVERWYRQNTSYIAATTQSLIKVAMCRTKASTIDCASGSSMLRYVKNITSLGHSDYCGMPCRGQSCDA